MDRLRLIGYRDTGSPAHRLDPISKIVVLLGFCIVAIFVRDLAVVVTALLTVLLMIRLSRIGLKDSLGRVRVLVILCVLLFGIQLLFVKTGGPLLVLSGEVTGIRMALEIYTGGVESGARIACRLLLIVASSIFFVGTTEPSRLAYALMQRGFPYRHGFMLVLALRFVPLFQIEAITVGRAQVARGLKVDSGGPRRLIRLARYTFMPLLISALARVGAISASMEARGFGASRTRSFLRTSSFSRTDAIVVAASALLTSVALAYGA